MASRVFVPPMSPARTCMRGNLPDSAPRSSGGGAVAALADGRGEAKISPMKIPTLMCALALLLAAGAQAQIETTIEPTGTAWSATAGRTVGNGNTVLQAEAGWPGVGFTYLHGANERTDIGFHVGLNYGFEGTTNTVAGVNFAVPYRH